jgi:DNA-binding GntR family transcriptional regulator
VKSANGQSEGKREPLKLRERAYESFIEHLLTGNIRPGQFLSQRELTELTKLPLGAIRELIPRLEVEGLIITVPQRGLQVVHADVKLIQDAFQFRLFLEREAAAIFAQEASDEMLAELRKAHESMLANFQRASNTRQSDLVAQAQELDWHLHNTLISFLGNPIIASAYRVNLLKLRVFRQERTRLNAAVVIPTMREHLVILEALASRDPNKAADAMTTHILHARDRALGLGTSTPAEKAAKKRK